jgi:hypothetical protein
MFIGERRVLDGADDALVAGRLMASACGWTPFGDVPVRVVDRRLIPATFRWRVSGETGSLPMRRCRPIATKSTESKAEVT